MITVSASLELPFSATSSIPTIYGPTASRTRRCLWALEEIGVPFRHVPIDLGQGEGRSAKYLALNPNGKVPTLVDGELVLSESAAICCHLADKHPKADLIPPNGTAERALCLQWMFFVIGELEQPLWNIGKHKFALPPERRVPALLDVARYEWGVVSRVLAQRLAGHPYLVSNRFSVADIMVAHTLAWARAFEVPLEDAAVESYADRMLARPAFVRTLAKERYSSSEPRVINRF
jgi:glutathione S-transferase